MNDWMRNGACCWCGDWPADEDRSCGDRNYCRKCEADRKRVYRARLKKARLSRWYAEVRTRDALKAAMLTSAIVDELGGYDRAAKRLVRYMKEQIASGRAPAESLRCCRAILNLIRLASPAN